MSHLLSAEEIGEYREYLEESPLVEITLSRTAALLEALDRGLASWVQAYEVGLGGVDGQFNRDPSLGLVIPKRTPVLHSILKENPLLAGPETDDTVDEVRVNSWLCNFYIVQERGDYEVSLTRLDQETWGLYEQELSSARLAISQLGLIDPQVKVHPPRVPGGFAPLSMSGSRDPERQTRLILDEVAAYLRDDVHVLVLPELTVPVESRISLLRFLDDHFNQARRPFLVVGGSAHELCDEGHRNIAPTYGIGYDRVEGRFKAGLLFAHAKMGPFNFGPRTLDLGHPDLRERGGEEDIVVSPRRIQMWDTPFGRLVVLICKDFLTVGVQETLLASRPDLILIPMMSAVARPVSWSSRGSWAATAGQSSSQQTAPFSR